MQTARLNIAVLCLATALNRAAPPLVVLTGGLIGLTLAPDPAWATLPVALIVVGMGVCAYPAAALMRRIGRRRGFALATMISVLAALAGAGAIVEESFVGFCAAMLVLGANQSFVQQYRFAAVENVPAERAGQAVSLILLSSLVSAYLGPEMGKEGRNWIADAPFAGAFLALAAVQAVAALLLLFYRDARLAEKHTAAPERPLAEILRQPAYVLAVVAGAVSYGVMSLIMTAAPLSMHAAQGHSLHVTAWAIEAHIVAMYLPSVFSGLLVSRYGVHRNISAGVMLMAGCIGVASLGHAAGHYMVALVLLGVGWNLLFTAGTTLLTTTYRASERFKAQGFNDLMVFGTMAAVSLASGVMLEYVGWHSLVLFMCLPLALMLMLAAAVSRRTPATQSA